MSRCSQEFYRMNALELAPALLGTLLCRKTEAGVVKRRIVETECYMGEDDTACHAHKGRTKRTEIMYGPGGFAYIYLCYGIHSLLNVVCGEVDVPQAVLIRGVEGFVGPGRLTKALSIDTSLNGESLITSKELWLECDGVTFAYTTGKRVGINYAAQRDIDAPWRFMADEPHKGDYSSPLNPLGRD